MDNFVTDEFDFCTNPTPSIYSPSQTPSNNTLNVRIVLTNAHRTPLAAHQSAMLIFIALSRRFKLCTWSRMRLLERAEELGSGALSSAVHEVEVYVKSSV